MSKTVVIVQSNYIPWKGYFDLLDRADEFVLLDDVQYTRRDWRNRNVIKSSHGLQWLTVPVVVSGKYSQLIKDTRVSDPSWPRHHWRSIERAYSRAAYFRTYRDRLEELYLGTTERYLSEINRRFLTALCAMLDIQTRLTWSMDYHVEGTKTERLISLCGQLGATCYLTGPSARCYLEEHLFGSAGIELQYMDYTGYEPYRQLHPPFVHQVSVIDVILNEGPAARRFVKSASCSCRS